MPLEVSTDIAVNYKVIKIRQEEVMAYDTYNVVVPRATIDEGGVHA